MNRIIIIGNGGTGKSTLGVRLSSSLNIPVYHLDQLSWSSGWKRVDEAEFKTRLRSIMSGERWIVEGWAYHSTLRERLEAADCIIYLKYPVWRAYLGATKRWAQYFFRQNPYDPPNTRRRKILRRTYQAMWKVYRVYEPELHSMLPEFEVKKQVVVVNSRRDLVQFLKDIGSNIETIDCSPIRKAIENKGL